MKFALLALALFSTATFAETTICSGTKDGKSVVFTIVKDDAKNVSSLSVSVDGARVGKKISQVRSSELAGGTMVTAQNDYGISSLSIFADDKRGCFAGTAMDEKDCYLGFVNLYEEDIFLRGIELSCE